jgi:hypothetical protein
MDIVGDPDREEDAGKLLLLLLEVVPLWLL